MPNPAPRTDDFPALLGDLYARWTLDCLIEIGYAISLDFVARPQLYQGDDIPDGIVGLRASYGSNADFANAAQRQAMMAPIFGRSDGLKPDASNAASSFHMARKKLVDACIAFSERAVDTGVSMLEDRVRSALVPLRAHFEGLRGKSFSLSYAQMKAESENVIRILTSPSVARVFSVAPAVKDWPLSSNDPNGAKLVEAAGSALALPAECKLGYTRFILSQRVAQEGGRALPLVLTADPNSEIDLHALISQVYSWGTSLRDFQQTP
jgi:hypothetical protein